VSESRTNVQRMPSSFAHWRTHCAKNSSRSPGPSPTTFCKLTKRARRTPCRRGPTQTIRAGVIRAVGNSDAIAWRRARVKSQESR